MAEFLIADGFVDSLKKLEKSTQEQVKDRLKFLAAVENPLLFAKKMKGYKDAFRFRSGDYRILFRLQSGKFVLLLVKHRKDIYAGL